MKTAHTVGDKYEATEKLDIAAVAKLVRADIAAAVKAGGLPPVKYSVRIRRFIDVSVTGYEAPNRAATMVLRAQIAAILAAYNYDDSDSMTDHYDVKFYTHVHVDWSLS